LDFGSVGHVVVTSTYVGDKYFSIGIDTGFPSQYEIFCVRVYSVGPAVVVRVNIGMFSRDSSYCASALMQMGDARCASADGHEWLLSDWNKQSRALLKG
jgi:hypothetical protein